MTAVASQVVPPMGLDEELDAAARHRILDAAHRLVTRVPIRRLVFRPDAGFWRVVDEAFPDKE
jgi:hypothetical protein